MSTHPDEQPLLCDTSSSPKIVSRAQEARQIKLAVYILGGITMILFEFAEFMMVVPRVRLYESIACSHFYQAHEPSLMGAGGSVPERLCKNEEVQSEVALLIGNQLFFDAIPGMLFSMPYGTLSDRYGRKPITLLSAVGVVLGFAWQAVICWKWKLMQLRLVWLSPLFNLIGGGESVMSAMVFAVATDVAEEGQRVKVFAWMDAIILATELIATSISSILVMRSPWIPMCIGMVSAIMALTLILALPETLNRGFSTRSDASNLSRQSAYHPADLSYPRASHFPGQMMHEMGACAKEIKYNLKIWLRTPTVLVLLSTFFVRRLFRISGKFLLPYISTRFGVSIAQSGIFLSLQSGTSLVLLVLILPGSTYLLRRANFSEIQKDVFLARTSIILLATGFMVIGIAPNLSILVGGLVTSSLGAAFSLVVRSLLSSLVEPQQLGSAYAASGIFNTFGMLICGPTLAGLFHIGLKLGLPFLGTGVLYGLMACVMFVVNLSRREA